MRYNAYWISPAGKNIGLDMRHIHYVIDNPNEFRLSTNYVKSVYDKYNEKIGQEGNAREEIMIELMKRGWIRARHNDNRGWIIQSYELKKSDKDNVWDFIRQLFDNKEIHKNTNVMVTDVKRSGIISSSAEGVLRGELYESNEYLTRRNIITEAVLKLNGNIKLNKLIYNSNASSVISEVKLSRIWQYVSNKDSAFGIISAFRYEYDEATNEERHDDLMSDIRLLKYGYILLKGGFTEDGKTTVEKSFFVPKMKRSDIVKLGMKYDQFSVIHKDGERFEEIGTNNDSGVNKILNQFSTDENSGLIFTKELVKKYFTSLMYGPHKDRKFVFKLYERESPSFNRIAYHNKTPLKWNLVMEEVLT